MKCFKHNDIIIKNSTIISHSINNTIYNYKDRYVIKSVNINNCNNIYYNYKNEYNILSKLNNQNIIKCYDSFYDISKSNYNIILPYYKYGDLHNYLTYKNSYDINTLIKKLIEPIDYLHQTNIIHLDLKLENYLISDTKDLVIIDFEHSKKCKNMDYYRLNKMTHIIGTKYFIAPEIMNDLRFSYSSDIYSLGCIIYTILSNNYLKDSNNIKLDFIENPKIKYILNNMLEYNSINRPTIMELKDYIYTEL